ncbi:MAG TPA: polysaccharide deacetylase family protein [Polyangiaceae bacterium]
MKLASVSIDLDELHHYHAIHGLSAPPGGAHAVYDLAVPRAADWARSLDVPVTWFAVGRDLERAESASALKKLVEGGHEVGNHSYSHAYDLSCREPKELRTEIDEGSRSLERAVGKRPKGFRAPGYTVSDDLFDALSELGVAYDSSVFPSPPYYAAKAAKLFSMRLRGRTSQSVLDTPSVLRAPSRPYRVGKPYWKSGNGVLELPIQVTPGARLPFIGTALVLAGADGARLLTRTVLGETFVNLELHGIDFLGSEDGLGALGAHQPDAKLPLSRKLGALTATIELLREKGAAFALLAEAADAYG